MKWSVLIVLLAASACAYNYEDFQRIDGDQQFTDFIQASPLNVVTFVDKQPCSIETDDKCREQRQQLEQIRDLCVSEHIQFALSTNTQLAEKHLNLYGSALKICFFRDGFPVIYSGSLTSVDHIQEWLGEVRDRLTRTLDDKSFEHDTQASTGSTTGDWFILFKKSNESRSLLPAWEATSLHFRNRAILAYVDVDTNPSIQKRFHLFKSPIFILLKRGKMYRYEGSSWKQQAFIEFLESSYQQVKGEVIPPEASAFAFSFTNVVKLIPMYLIVIPMVCLAAVLLVLISGFPKRKKIATERIPFQVKID